MKLIIIFISIIVCFKTVSYGLFEIKQNKNTFGGIFVIVLATISTILPNVVICLKGI